MADGEQPFVILPPPGAVLKAEPTPVEPELVDLEPLIGLPPGVLDSGTYRLPTPRTPKPGRLDDAPVFFPSSAPGLPPVVVPVEGDDPAPPTAPAPTAVAPATAPAPIVAPIVAPLDAPLDAADEAFDDATRASLGRRSAPAWRLALPDGREVLLERTTLVGRDPAAGGQWSDAALLSITDPGKSVSKTHAALELTATGQLLVHDLDSTNGVYLRYPGSAEGSEETEVTSGAPALIEPGVELNFGDFTVMLTRR